MTPVHFTYRGLKGYCGENNFVTLAGMGCHYDQLSPESEVKQLIDKLRDESEPNLLPLFDREVFIVATVNVALKFDKTAPVVSEWCDELRTSANRDITLADLALLWYLHTEEVSPSNAITTVLRHKVF
jgi:hypothetical protein